MEQNVALWAIGIAITGFVAGYGAYRSIMEVSGQHILQKGETAVSEAELTRLRSDSAHLTAQAGQNEFLVRYLRYEVAKMVADYYKTESTRADVPKAKKLLVDMVYSLWKKQGEFPTSSEMRAAIIRKGFDPLDSRIRFADNSEWPLPREIKEEVLERD